MSSSVARSFGSSVGRLWLGRVVRLSTVGIDDKPIAHVRVTKQQFDEHLRMFFGHPTDYWSHDIRGLNLQIGDEVLISEMKTPLARDVQHRVQRIVQRHGKLVDPITKRRVLPQRDKEWTDLYKEKYEDRSRYISEVLGKPGDLDAKSKGD